VDGLLGIIDLPGYVTILVLTPLMHLVKGLLELNVGVSSGTVPSFFNDVEALAILQPSMFKPFNVVFVLRIRPSIII
jgi:hypothetical protein